MYIVVGLGNPGEKYAHTHHNAGFDTLDLFAKRLNVSLNKTRCKAKIAETYVGGERVILAEPQTFMNLSGASVAALMRWYRTEPDHLVVIYDDIDLPAGRVRYRAKGGSGTHNGMRSILSVWGRDDFPRIRVGVGAAPKGWDLVDWVLSSWRTDAEKDDAMRSFGDACDILDVLIREGSVAASRLSGEIQKKNEPEKTPKRQTPKYNFSPVADAIAKRIDDRFVSGAACAVMMDGRMAWQYVKGLADIETGRKITRDTTFRLASMTKPLTAASTMILADRGLVDLDDPVGKYLPEFAEMRVVCGDPKANPAATVPARRPITLRHILTHSSGLGQETDLWSRRISSLPEEQWTLENIVRESARVPLDFHPGERTGYSAVAAMNLLTRIVEVVTGLPYEAFLSTEILAPLGMGDTTYLPDERQWNRIAEVYRPFTLEKIPIGRMGFDGMKRPYACGGAGLVGTLPDYLKFAAMLLSGGELNGARVLSREAVAAMKTPQLPDAILPSSDAGETWGLGMRVILNRTESQPLPPGCFGWSGAYGTHFWIDPGHNLVCVLMAAGDVGGAGSPLSRDVERAVMTSLDGI